MKSTILLSFFLLLSLISVGQEPAFNWVRQINNDIFISSVVSRSGYVYMTGTFIGTVDFDPGPGFDTISDYGFGDIFISKMDSLGNMLWVHRIGGSSYDEGDAIAFDTSGNMYVTGFFSGDSVDFDPGPGINYMSCGENTFVLKLDANGNFIWAKQLGGVAENYGVSIAIDKASNILVTGKFGGQADFDPGTGSDTLTAFADDIYFWKLDKDGNYIWARQIASLPSTTRSYAIATDNANNILVSGMLIGTADLDPGAGTFNLTHSGSLSASFILKLDAMGNFVWAEKIENSNPFLYNGALLLDATGNIYIGGEFSGTVDFDPGTTVVDITSTPANSYFLLKLDNNGSFQWATALPDVKCIALDKAGNIYTCGIVTNKYNASGTQQWTIDSTHNTCISVDGNNDIYTTGSFSGTVDFDPGPGVSALTSTSSSTFILRMHPVGTSGVGPVYADNEISVYPNPTAGRLNVMSSNKCKMAVTNSIGQRVRSFSAEAGMTMLDVSDLADGVYFISDINNKTVCVPVMIQH